MKKKNTSELHNKMKDMVYDEFLSTMKAGVIVVTVDEMTNVFVNLLAEFMEFQRVKGVSK